MTPCTGNRQSQQATAEGIDPFIPVVGGDGFDHRLGQPGILVIGRRGAEVTQCPEISALEIWQQVGGQLHDQEPVVRQVGVDRFDHPVAVPPPVGMGAIGGLAGRVVFGPAGHVEPVSAPAFTVVPTGQQPVDQAG